MGIPSCLGLGRKLFWRKLNLVSSVQVPLYVNMGGRSSSNFCSFTVCPGCRCSASAGVICLRQQWGHLLTSLVPHKGTFHPDSGPQHFLCHQNKGSPIFAFDRRGDFLRIYQANEWIAVMLKAPDKWELKSHTCQEKSQNHRIWESRGPGDHSFQRPR